MDHIRGLWRILLVCSIGISLGGCSAYTIDINTKGSATNSTTTVAQPAADTTNQRTSLPITLDSIPMSEIESQMGLALPADITDVHSHVQRGLHTVGYLRFTAPTSTVDQWLNRVSWSQPLGTNPYAYLDVNTLDWWDANMVENPTTGVVQYVHPQLGPFYAHVLLDQRVQNQTTAYLVAVDQ